MQINDFSEKMVQASLQPEYKDFKFLKNSTQEHYYAQFEYRKYKLYVEGKIKKDEAPIQAIIEMVNEERYDFEHALISDAEVMRIYITRMLKKKYSKELSYVSNFQYIEFRDRLEDRLRHEINNRSYDLDGYNQLYKQYERDFDINKFIKDSIEVSNRYENK